MSTHSNKTTSASKLNVRSSASGRFVKTTSGKKHPKSVKGGLVFREAKTGRFTEVQTDKGVTKASSKSRASVKEASSKRSAALKRLANR